MAALPRYELERVKAKYMYIARFPHSLTYLERCPDFMSSRRTLLNEGFLDWQILDAAIQAMARFRLGLGGLQGMAYQPSVMKTFANRMMTYLWTFHELGDEGLPECSAWRVDDLRHSILSNGLAWLARRKLVKRGPLPADEPLELLKKHGYFDVDPRPSEWRFGEARNAGRSRRKQTKGRSRDG